MKKFSLKSLKAQTENSKCVNSPFGFGTAPRGGDWNGTAQQTNEWGSYWERSGVWAGGTVEGVQDGRRCPTITLQAEQARDCLPKRQEPLTGRRQGSAAPV